MTQYQKIGRLIVRKKGATTRELIDASGSVCPWKRLQEMAKRGWTIWNEPIPGRTHVRYFGKAPR